MFFLLPSATVVAEGNVFTSVYHSFCLQWGTCMAKGGVHGKGGGGACVVKEVCGKVGCVWWGDMHGRGHVWQGACMVRGVHGMGGICGRGMHSRGHAWLGGGRAWQERRPLQRTVCILLECILVVNRFCTVLEDDWTAEFPIIARNHFNPNRCIEDTFLEVCII